MNPITQTLRQSLRQAQPSRFVAGSIRSKSTTAVPAQTLVLPDIQLGPTHPSRYHDHYNNTLVEDLLYMTYDHDLASPSPSASTSTLSSSSTPPIVDPSSLNPYELNRPSPSPRGNRPLKPATRPVTATSVPKLESIVLHTMVKEAIGNKPAMLSAIMALRAISGETYQGGGRKAASGVQVLVSKSGAAAFKLRAGMPVAVKVEIKGEAMYDFVQSLVDFVLPRLREFPGVQLPMLSANKNSPSATSGVVAFGLEAGAMGLFPQIETNLESYPKMHGFHMQFLTNCKGKGAQDQARALLSGMRIPFTRR
jgi:large subunit ribosomal protein L5